MISKTKKKNTTPKKERECLYSQPGHALSISWPVTLENPHGQSNTSIVSSTSNQVLQTLEKNVNDLVPLSNPKQIDQ